jgi:hypothetical protein
MAFSIDAKELFVSGSSSFATCNISELCTARVAMPVPCEHAGKAHRRFGRRTAGVHRRGVQCAECGTPPWKETIHLTKQETRMNDKISRSAECLIVVRAREQRGLR